MITMPATVRRSSSLNGMTPNVIRLWKTIHQGPILLYVSETDLGQLENELVNEVVDDMVLVDRYCRLFPEVGQGCDDKGDLDIDPIERHGLRIEKKKYALPRVFMTSLMVKRRSAALTWARGEEDIRRCAQAGGDVAPSSHAPCTSACN